MVFKTVPCHQLEYIFTKELGVDRINVLTVVPTYDIGTESLKIIRIPAYCFGAFTFGFIAHFIVSNQFGSFMAFFLICFLIGHNGSTPPKYFLSV